MATVVFTFGPVWNIRVNIEWVKRLEDRVEQHADFQDLQGPQYVVGLDWAGRGLHELAA